MTTAGSELLAQVVFFQNRFFMHSCSPPRLSPCCSIAPCNNWYRCIDRRSPLFQSQPIHPKRHGPNRTIGIPCLQTIRQQTDSLQKPTIRPLYKVERHRFFSRVPPPAESALLNDAFLDYQTAVSGLVP